MVSSRAANNEPPVRILIVDDDPALLMALPDTIQLHIPGAIVHNASSGADAIKFATDVDYDVIVTDLVMPGMTGIDLIEKIKELRPRTPMILISGNPNPRGYAVRTRAFGFVQKPIDRDYFIESLRRSLHYSRLTKKITKVTDKVDRYLEQVAELRRYMAEQAAAAPRQHGGDKRASSAMTPEKTSVSERS
ncbi:response regulator [Nitrospira sp. Nam74]